ncbi:MAG: hypothetical protein NTW61_04620 [Candidatus Melainabacteria bacterium]|nr:hypothetical protein [Candidatus Melainabacteria bacterium]
MFKLLLWQGRDLFALRPMRCISPLQNSKRADAIRPYKSTLFNLLMGIRA